MIYRVYVKINDKRRITAVDSSGFLTDLTGWTQIDEGNEDKFYLAQSNYFPKMLTDERNIYRYALDENDKVCELTQEEMDADYEALPPPPSDRKRIAALEAQLAAYEAAFAEGVSEGWA